MNIAHHDAARSAVSRIIDWMAKGWERASEADMIASLDDETIREIAHDCGIQPDQLIALAKAGPHAADEMPAMMRALGIDPMEVETRFREQFRAMQIDCSNCTSKDECRRDLKDGTAAQHFNDYCANADDLSSLRASPEVLAD
ncbi:hypothetical protein HGO38_10275 [Rhizobium sp. CG5]|uniref:DUF6455 family protein n=1 Tax=Rhizobium sp. CG5 TaxID=2726076 RepID=UPI0020347329|nr:DUF6455 family protein [Rhizobium sp. CG5]MCM2473858.1 hypothetical protein [Rhizobium sp. CG5]